jgi:hypothetical protein
MQREPTSSRPLQSDVQALFGELQGSYAQPRASIKLIGAALALALLLLIGFVLGRSPTALLWLPVLLLAFGLFLWRAEPARLRITPDALIWELPGSRRVTLEAAEITGFSVHAATRAFEIVVRSESQPLASFRATPEMRARLRLVEPELLQRLGLSYVW